MIILFNNMETPLNISCAPETLGISLYYSLHRVTDIHIVNSREFHEFIVRSKIVGKEQWKSCYAKRGNATKRIRPRNT